MEEPRHKSIRITVGAVLLLVLAALVVGLYLYYFGKDSDTGIQETGDPTSTSSESADQNSNVEPEPEEQDTVDPDSQHYYQKSMESAQNKNYAQAIEEITLAIQLDNKIDVYWAKKASYQALSGDSAAEKATLEEGLRLNPDSDILKVRLEVWGQDIGSDYEGVRE